MLFHKQIENIYKAQMFARCDDSGLAHYFSYKDFNGLHAEKYSFSSSLGHKMQGYFYSYDAYDDSRLIIFEHGFGGGHRSYMKEIEMLCRNGYRVFAYDHTGCMESGGDGARGFSQSLHDLDDALKALKADENVNTSDISIIGHSWGGFSTLNISALHGDIKKVVVLCGFISVEKIIEQNFPRILKGYRKYIFAIEKESNPDCVSYNATETLSKADTKALLIYSDDDPLVHKNVHYDALYSALRGKKNVEFLLVSGKGHNPNYTHSAVKLLGELAKATKKAKKLRTAEEKESFRNSFDWDKMTEQDLSVWDRILEFLK